MFLVLIIYYFYLITCPSGGKFFIVNTNDNRPSSRDVKNIDFNEASDNSLADYNDDFEKIYFPRRKFQKFQNFIKNNPELWKDANEITKSYLINFLKFQYRRNSMLKAEEEGGAVMDGVV